jgi:hypothetical protein
MRVEVSSLKGGEGGGGGTLPFRSWGHIVMLPEGIKPANKMPDIAQSPVMSYEGVCVCGGRGRGGYCLLISYGLEIHDCRLGGTRNRVQFSVR